jgi:hypothetical protein
MIYNDLQSNARSGKGSKSDSAIAATANYRKIENADFNKLAKTFDKSEKCQAPLFYLAQNLIEKDFEVEGMLLILTTWNSSGFQYAMQTFDINSFAAVVKELKPKFAKFADLDFRTINFDSYAGTIKAIYEALSAIKGIKYTGASKLMHLSCPNVFVMWDGYIRGEKSVSQYQQLDVYKNGFFHLKKYPADGDGYIDFLKDMQQKFGHLTVSNPSKPLTKALDEYNYVTITLPIQEVEKEKKKAKKIINKVSKGIPTSI